MDLPLNLKTIADRLKEGGWNSVLGENSTCVEGRWIKSLATSEKVNRAVTEPEREGRVTSPTKTVDLIGSETNWIRLISELPCAMPRFTTVLAPEADGVGFA